MPIENIPGEPQEVNVRIKLEIAATKNGMTS